MTIRKEIIGLIETNFAQIEKYGIKRIGIFGSYARGEETAESDIDILIDFIPGKKSFDNYMDLKFYLEKLLGRKVDLVISENVKPALKTNIFDEVKYATRI